MPVTSHIPTDEQVEQRVGNLLRLGVSMAALLVLIGGCVYLVKHGQETVEDKIFHGEPAELRSLEGIIAGAKTFGGRALIQLGLLVLIATPVARVGYCLFAFIKQRDRIYIVVTTIVLAVLLFSLISESG